VERVLLTPANTSRKTLETFAEKVMPHVKAPAKANLAAAAVSAVA
jgi:hypothetical protein